MNLKPNISKYILYCKSRATWTGTTRRSSLSDIASDWSSNRRIIRMVVRTGTSHPMTRDLLNYIYYMYCKSRATSPEQVSKWTSKRTHPDQKVAKLRYQTIIYRTNAEIAFLPPFGPGVFLPMSII